MAAAHNLYLTLWFDGDKVTNETTELEYVNFVLFDFVHRPVSKIIKLQLFVSWFLLRLQVKKEGRGQKAYLLGPLDKLALDLTYYEALM
jgi:hypothetical protein